jgi:hypothetical protein
VSSEERIQELRAELDYLDRSIKTCVDPLRKLDLIQKRIDIKYRLVILGHKQR